LLGYIAAFFGTGSRVLYFDPFSIGSGTVGMATAG